MRPCQNCTRSSSDVETLIVVAPLRLGDLRDALDEVVDLARGAIEFGDDETAGVARITAGLEILGGDDGGVVHHFHAAGDDALRR